jgi:hypothetical protein
MPVFMTGIRQKDPSGSFSALSQENVVQTISSLGNGKDLMALVASGSRYIRDGFSRIENNPEGFPGFHGFELQLGLDEIERALDASQVENLVRNLFGRHKSLRVEKK